MLSIYFHYLRVSHFVSAVSTVTLLSSCALGGGENPTVKDVLLTPVVIATTPVLVVGFVAAAAATSNEPTTGKPTPSMDDAAKLEFAKKAASYSRCKGKTEYLTDEPPVTNDPSERTYLVHCGKAEMKVTCRYYETSVNECYVKWVD